jgi:hypothetical protein
MRWCGLATRRSSDAASCDLVLANLAELAMLNTSSQSSAEIEFIEHQRTYRGFVRLVMAAIAFIAITLSLMAYFLL